MNNKTLVVVLVALLLSGIVSLVATAVVLVRWIASPSRPRAAQIIARTAERALETQAEERANLEATPTAPVFADFLAALDRNGPTVERAFRPDSVVYQVQTGAVGVTEVKTFGVSDAAALGPSNWFHGLPRLAPDRRALYLRVNDAAAPAGVRVAAIEPGKPARELFAMPEADPMRNYYDVAPEGSEIAFQVRPGSELSKIFRFHFADSRKELFTASNVGGVFPAYSPDGKWIAYVSLRRLRIRNVQTAEEKVLVNDDLVKELPAWSPDGRWIAYQASDGGDFGYDVWKVDVDSGRAIRLSEARGDDANPCFSADGQRIIFVSERETGPGKPTLYMMNADGSDARRDPTAKTGIHFPRW